ncbi:hypothetical protein TRSC58_01396 [Trypanosoma rangeli SC58]|uniref:Uncharacterized protein n=1 Tax=Trypanosoma rangeli SC58 TaxID=429131 RepID=A0A061J7K4_TRYRA|nr:hypothetical protein TRSC58_01396 [Trypanosoma rangeli SC58]
MGRGIVGGGGGRDDADYFVSSFLDDLCRLVSRYLTQSCGTRAGLLPAPPSASSLLSSSRISFVEPVAAATPVEGRQGVAESMLCLVDEARSRISAREEKTDFSTEGAVFFLALRSLLESHPDGDWSSWSTPSRLTMAGDAVGQSPAGTGLQYLNHVANAPRRRILRHMLRIPNAVNGDIGEVGASKRKVNTAEVSCQTKSLEELSRGYQHASLYQAAAALHRGSVPALSAAHGRLALLLQHHTMRSILTLGDTLFEAHNDFIPLKECDHRIQTNYVGGIIRELKREQERLNRQSLSKTGISELEQLHSCEIVHVLERLERAVPFMDGRIVFVEEVDEGSEERGASDGRVLVGADDAEELVGLFGSSGAGFVSRLVAYSIQCFLSALSSATAFPQRWSYLEKVLFFTDTESPVPTVPVELNATLSRGSTDMDVGKTPTPELSERVRVSDIDELQGIKSTTSAGQGSERQLQGLVRKFCPCRVYEEVRYAAAPLDVKGVW